MPRRLYPYEVKFLSDNLEIIDEMLDDWHNDPDCNKLESELSDIKSSFIEDEIDAETFLDKLDEFLRKEHSEKNSNFSGIMFSDVLKAHQYATLGYEFDGEPAHPELFDLNIDKFNDKNEGKFKYISPKIGGKQFTYRYSNKRRDEEDDDYWIELEDPSSSSFFSAPPRPYHIHIVTKEGKLLKTPCNLISLSSLIWLCDENSEYKIAFVEEIEGLGLGTPRELSPQELNNFKSYTRAFIEALEGRGDYTEDLNNNMDNKPDKDWVSIIISIALVLIVLVGVILIFS